MKLTNLLLFVFLTVFNVFGQQNVVTVLDDATINDSAKIVVTALGIKKETKTLGYAISSVTQDEISIIRTTSPLPATAKIGLLYHLPETSDLI